MRPFYDPATVWNGSLSEAEGRAKWKEVEEAGGRGSGGLCDVAGLSELLERADKDGADLSNAGAGRALGLFWEAESLEQIPRGRLTFLRAYVAEARRLDAHFSRKALEVESEAQAAARGLGAGPAPETILGQLAASARQSHASRAGLLWLLMRSARSAGDVASLLVVLEEQSFWKGQLWRAAFRACAQSVYLSRGAAVAEGGAAEEGTAEESEDRKKAAGGKKKKKQLKKKLKKYVPSAAVPSLPDAAAPRQGRVARRLCFWVRPSLEWAAKSALLARTSVVPQAEDRCALVGGTRIHLDTGKWQRYKQTVRAMDPSLVAPAEAAAECAVTAEWDGAGAVVRVVVSRANGVFSEEILTGPVADALLRGASETSLGMLVNEAQLSPVLRVSSSREVYVHAEGQVAIVWDADVVFSDATTAPAQQSMLAWSKTLENAIAFPYQLVTVTAEEGGSLKEVMAAMEKDDSFIRAPDFDEYVTGVALVHDVGNARPPWMAGLLKSWRADWTQAFHAAGSNRLSLWGSAASKRRARSEKGKEEGEQEEEEEHDIVMRIGNVLKQSPRSSDVPMQERGEGAALLQRRPWAEELQESPPAKPS